jgi:triphosphoribosyl-dephospho-CoA synthase
MAAHPDSLIIRKCGLSVADGVRRFAADLLESEWPDNSDADAGLHDLDRWLRSDGNKRNPGTSADLVTASLFVLLREGTIDPAIPFSPLP